MTTFFIPAALNIDKHLSENPPHRIKGFKRSDLLYLLHVITEVRSKSKNPFSWNDFVPLKADLLRKKVRNYRAYLDYLIDTGVIVSDNWYIVGTKSIGYRFSPAYNGVVVPVAVSDYCLEKSIRNERKLPLRSAKEYAYLTKWFDEGLTIDYEAARDFLMLEFEAKLRCPLLRDFDFATKTYKSPYHQYNSGIQSAEKFRASDFSFTIDDSGFRFHSVLTGCRSELRHFLRYKGSDLVSIDIANSQPYLCCLLFNPVFWTGIGEYKDLFSISEIFSSSSSFSSFIMMCKNEESRIDSDVHRFRELVKAGRLYEYIEANILKPENSRGLNKRNVKAALFQVLFTDNRFYGQKEAEPKRLFRELFPSVYALLSALKRKNRRMLPILLQRVESKIVLKDIARHISKERTDLPLFTIHDSIVTTKGNEQYVMEVMKEYLGKAVGFAPMLRIENWCPGALHEEADFLKSKLRLAA